jgi:hypothetical protein
MATATKKATGFRLSCPFCGASNDPAGDSIMISIDLGRLDEIKCDACDEVFSPAQAVEKATERLAAWQAVALWIETARGLLD